MFQLDHFSIFYSPNELILNVLIDHHTSNLQYHVPTWWLSAEHLLTTIKYGLQSPHLVSIIYPDCFSNRKDCGYAGKNPCHYSGRFCSEIYARKKSKGGLANPGLTGMLKGSWWMLKNTSNVYAIWLFSDMWSSMVGPQCYCQQHDEDVKRMLRCAVCQRYFHLSMHHI